MKLAVTFYEGGTGDPPAGWPKEARWLADEYTPGPGEAVMTLPELEAYRAERQEAYDAWERSKENPQRRAGMLAEIKMAAQERIIALTGGGEFWRERQSNMTARFAELLDAERYGELSGPDAAEKAALKAFWGKVKAIRVHSNALESAYLAGDPIDLEAGWPE